MIESPARRRDPSWYTPADLPVEVIAFNGSVRGGLDVGAAGKVGVLDLGLCRHGGATRIERHYQRVPLHVYRPIYLDEARPDMAFVFVQQFGEGFVQGDRYRIDVECAPGAAAHITTQAATNVFGANQNFAAQIVNLRADAGAVLEYLPNPVVPFRGSRLFQRTRVTAHRDATVILGETLLPGRVAHREAHAYDLYWSEIEVRRPEGRLLLADVLRLNPAQAGIRSRLACLASTTWWPACTSFPDRRNRPTSSRSCDAHSPQVPKCSSASASYPTSAAPPPDFSDRPPSRCRPRSERHGMWHVGC